MLSLRHPNVVSILGVCLKPPAIVTGKSACNGDMTSPHGTSAQGPPPFLTNHGARCAEFCARGSLYDVLRKAADSPAHAAQLTWARRLSMALGAAKGCLYLHSCQPPIIHRDLKVCAVAGDEEPRQLALHRSCSRHQTFLQSPNLLLDDAWRLKISDFNLSDRTSNGASILSAGQGNNPLWLSPEQLDDDVKQARFVWANAECTGAGRRVAHTPEISWACWRHG